MKSPKRAKPAKKVMKPRRSARPAAAGVEVSAKPIGSVAAIAVIRGGKMYVHQFKGQVSAFPAAGGRGLLVIKGSFHLDGQGFIHDER